MFLIRPIIAIMLPICMLLLLVGSVGAWQAILEWTPPTTNEDDSPLTDLAGFKIYWGLTDGGPYGNSITVDSPSATSTTVTDLPNDTIYFVATAYDTSNNESGYSNQVSVVFPITITSAVLSSFGTSLIVAFSRSTTVGGGYSNSHFDVDCSTSGVNIPATYQSGSGTSSFIFTLVEAIPSTNTCDLDFCSSGSCSTSIRDGSYNYYPQSLNTAITNNSSYVKTQKSLGSSTFSGGGGVIK